MKAFLLRLGLASSLLGLGWFGLLSVPTTALAQQRMTFRPTSTGAPGNRESGANRSGACTNDETGLVALLPDNNVATTYEAYPPIFAYFPNSTAQYAEFALYEEGSNELVYGALFDVTGRSGLVTLDLPNQATLTPLQVGQRYYWYLTLICNVQDRSSDLTVQGNFERLAADGTLTQQVQSASLGQRPFIYAQAGLWPETIESLLAASRANPNDATARGNLSDLLRSVGLNSVAEESLLP
jgi:Domain of Unknown Function (DUF928)